MSLRDIKNSILEYLFIILTILNYISVFYRSPNNLIHYSFNIIWEFILFYFFILSLKNLSYIKLQKYIKFSTLYIFIVSMALILYYFYFPYSLNYILIYLLNPILLIMIFLNNSYNLLIKFERITIILSIISIVFWIFNIIGIEPNSTLAVSYGDIYHVPSYFNISFFPQGPINFLGFNNLSRNSGIFSEPSMYSYVLCVAFLIELFIKNKKNTNIINFKIIILFITILSTTSTTGIMIAIPSFLVYLFVNVKSNLLRFIFIIIFPVSILFFRYVLSDKTSGIDDITSSSSIRMNDFYASFMAWKQHLFIGNGIGNDDAISQFMYSFRFYYKNTGSSTGILSALGYGGLIYGLFYVLPNILLLFKRNYNIALFSIFILILNIFTNVLISYICIFVLSYLWAYFLRSSKESLY